MFSKAAFTNLGLLIALQCFVYPSETATAPVKNGEGNSCVANRMRALANSAVPYNNQTICEIEKKFLNCISSTPKPSTRLNILQHLLSCTRLRLMKTYNFCEVEKYDCEFPQELAQLPEDQKFVFPEFEMMDFGQIHLEGCLNLFTYMQRYSIHPCTETAISALCMKPLIKGLGLFESSNKYFSKSNNELSCNCAEIAQHLCDDAILCPTDIFNRDWKSFAQNNKKVNLFRIDEKGQCVPQKPIPATQIDRCLEMDFKTVGKCLQKRYKSYADMSFGDTKLPFDRHCDIENDVYNCLSKTSQSELDERCNNNNNFIIWARIQSYITMKILQISKKCSIPSYSINLDKLLAENFPIRIKLNLINWIGIIGDKLITPCNQQAIDSCYYVRGYMHEFLVHPCIEWMMFYRCIRDNLMACGEPAAAKFITQFLEGRTELSINKNNQWNHNECALLNEMRHFGKNFGITTMNIINPFKKNIDI